MSQTEFVAWCNALNAGRYRLPSKKLYCRLAELQKSLTQSREEIVAAKEDHSASIARLEATHASSMSSKDDSASKVKNLLDETEAEKEEKMAELNRVQQVRVTSVQIHHNAALSSSTVKIPCAHTCS